MGCHKKFGGKLILLMHDFRQILPVIIYGSRPAAVSASVKFSDTWEHFEECSLKENMRVQRTLSREENPSNDRIKQLREYSEWLLRVGNGTVPPAIEGTNIIEVPQQMVYKTKQELEDKVYNDFEANYNNKEYLVQRAIMSSTNKTLINTTDMALTNRYAS